MKTAEEKNCVIALKDLSAGLGYSTDKTLARYFSTSRKTIWAWAREGRIPKPHKISANMTRWDNAEMRDYLGGL